MLSLAVALAAAVSGVLASGGSGQALPACAPYVWPCIKSVQFLKTSKGTEYQLSVHIYGKYYHIANDTGAHEREANTFYLYTPLVNETTPIIVEYHGGGFVGGKASAQATTAIEQYLDAGFAWASMDYRLTTTKYHYRGPGGRHHEEEFIRVSKEGKLSLDRKFVLSDYKVRVGRTEFVSKCQYDATRGVEHLVTLAPTYNFDPHRMGLTGGSAGGGEINYLTWVYHQWNQEKYTPRSMVYQMAQFNYPVQNALDRMWNLFATDLGHNFPISRLISLEECSRLIANEWCYKWSETPVCNMAWQRKAIRYCAPAAYRKTTLGDLVRTQRWPTNTTFEKGVEKQWYSQTNMQNYHPKNMSIYIANWLNTTQMFSVVHHAVYARYWGLTAEKAGINYVAYYTDYDGMPDEARTPQRFSRVQPKGPMGIGGGLTVFNYRSGGIFSNWKDLSAVQGVTTQTVDEQILFHKKAMGYTL